ncbi:putative neuraminidase (sialidase) [Echinicola vietnamensis DSM 17526]|uniref:Putative neuraminidase (Sialidase) n=2 Tax=Echinicola TaxID=390846 RepID=L0FVU3_ECHVK|nr:putative neuraminidase (sialidase) [Echinicola vietnamensis DSM 17526]
MGKFVFFVTMTLKLIETTFRIPRLAVVFGMFLILVLPSFGQDQVKVITEEFVFDNAPFRECHASTLVGLKDGSIMAAWFGGEYERHPNVGIWIARKTGTGWSQPQKVADGQVNDTLSYPTWNPVLFNMTPDSLVLFYKEGPSPQEWWGMYKVSVDEGKTWSSAQKLPEGILGPIKNKPITLRNGAVLAPSSVEDEDGWRAHVEITEDHGKTWKKVAIDHEGEYDVIQPSILQHADGRLQVLCRSQQNRIITAWSEDQGRSWGQLSATEVLNPNSGTDAVTLADGRFLLVYNPEVSGKDWSDGRNELRLAVSTDGVSWNDVMTLEHEPSGEFSYPAIIQTTDGKVHISYTWKRKKIKYVVLEIVGHE